MGEKINGFDIPDGSILLEPRKYHDKAIIGFKDVVLYDYDLLLDSFVEQGMTYEEASEWISYNTIRTGQYIDNFPKVIDKTHVMEEDNRNENET